MTSGRLDSQTRRVNRLDHDGLPVHAMIADCIYTVRCPDLWHNITDKDNLSRWLGPVSGDFLTGGSYQIEGNAGGTIERCEPPSALDLTWEFGDVTNWVELRLTALDEGTRLELKHLSPVDAAQEHWESYGPSATGVGWDMWLMRLGQYLETGHAVDFERSAHWFTTDEGKQFVNVSTTAWSTAHIAAGADEQSARTMAERTAAAYTAGG